MVESGHFNFTCLAAVLDEKKISKNIFKTVLFCRAFSREFGFCIKKVEKLLLLIVNFFLFKRSYI